MSDVIKYKCWYCGAIHERPVNFEPMNRIFCEECKEKFKAEKEKILHDYVQLKIHVMHENALRILEKAMCPMGEFQYASEIILNDALERPEKYNSTHEILVAIYLESEGYYFEINHSILSYRIDFYIPDLKICLEVDGALHKHNRKYDNERDIRIRHELGFEWEVIRIPTKYIEQNPSKILDAIAILAKEKKNYRKNNNGIITEAFSKREEEHYNSILAK